MPDSPTSEPESDFVCGCEDWMRSACAGEPFYKEHEGKRYCVLHFPGKDKSADFQIVLKRKLEDKDFDFQGVWFPDELTFSRFDFSAAADFSSATFAAAVDFSSATFRAAGDFRSATFGAVADFSSTTFSATAYFFSATFKAAASFRSANFTADASFRSATFRAAGDFRSATFGAVAYFNSAFFSAAAYFNNAAFSGETHFRSATFSADASFNSAFFSAHAYFGYAAFTAEASFTNASFSAAAYFTNATFSAKVGFSFSTLSAADFRYATFSADADFDNATLKNNVKFAGSKRRLVFSHGSSLNLQFAKIEEPDHVSFHTLTLHPHWFVNVNARRFDFTNVDWPLRGVLEEIESLENKGVSSPHRLLAIACRDLAVNAEENHRYEEASKFRYMAMEARRIESWRGLAFWRLSWWYWLASGYGERVFKAFIVLLGIWLVAGLLYTRVGFARWEPKLASESDLASAKRDDIGAPFKFGRALMYSAAVMTFQKPEPRPATTAAQTVVLLETILGPVQAALLALAIRRKFMR